MLKQNGRRTHTWLVNLLLVSMVACFVGTIPIAAQAAPAAEAVPQTTRVAATDGWVTTDIYLKVGDVISGTASGNWCYGGGCNGPNGTPTAVGGRCDVPYLLEGPYYNLVARTGTTVISLGRSFTVTVSEEGPLAFAYNDCFYPNNSGSVNVDFTVTSTFPELADVWNGGDLYQLAIAEDGTNAMLKGWEPRGTIPLFRNIVRTSLTTYRAERLVGPNSGLWVQSTVTLGTRYFDETTAEAGTNRWTLSDLTNYNGTPARGLSRVPSCASTDVLLAQIEAMTIDDLQVIYDTYLAWKSNNPNATPTEQACTLDVALADWSSGIASTEYHAFDLTAYTGSVIRFNNKEQQLCEADRIKCVVAVLNGRIALEEARIFYQDGATEGRQDAYKHALWNALMTVDLGADWAERWATAHEDGYGRNFQDAARTLRTAASRMDMFNNAVGRDIVVQGNFSPVNLRAALEAGQLVALRYDATRPQGYLVRTSTCTAALPCGK